MKKRLLPVVLSFFVILAFVPGIGAAPVQAAAAAGTTDWEALSQSGFTLNGKYYIATAEDLMTFRDMINGLSNDGVTYSCSFYLTADIELNSPDLFYYGTKG
ncbi:MAG: hypothetical protein IJO79_05540, partial [Firmicutes bacterium]|nr:hypothetical protein [Bacillota bacterium]